MDLKDFLAEADLIVVLLVDDRIDHEGSFHQKK